MLDLLLDSPVLLLAAAVTALVLALQAKERADALKLENEGLQRRMREIELRMKQLEASATGIASPSDIAAATPAPASPSPATPPTIRPEAPPEVAGSVVAGTAHREAPAVGVPSPERRRFAPGDRPLPAAIDAPPPETPPLSLEAFLGQRVFLVVGIVVVLLGLGWFLKYAIDREWIGPAARIAMGFAAGLAALWGGDRLQARHRLFGQGVMGGGLGALFLSTFFAAARYELIGNGPAFALVALLTAGGAALALRREAPLLAHLGFLGGFLAPAVLSTGEDRLWGLAGWLVLLDAGLFAVATRRAWRGLDLMAAVAALVYLSAWQSRFGSGDRIVAGSAALALLTAAVLALALVPSLLRREPPPGTALAAAAMGFPALLVAHRMLFPDHRLALGVGALGLAAAHFAGSRGTVRRAGAGTASNSLLGFALVALAIAVPAFLSGDIVAPVWAALGVALLLAGSRPASTLLLSGGSGMLVLAACHVLLRESPLHPDEGTAFLNGPFLAAALAVVAPMAGAWILRRRGTPEGMTGLDHILHVGGTWGMALVLLREAMYAVGPGPNAVAPAAGIVKGVPPALLAVWTLAALYPLRRATTGWRVFLLCPLALALLMGLGLVFRGETLAPPPLLNVGFVLGLVIATALFLAGSGGMGGFGTMFRGSALVYLLLLITADIARWGSSGPVGDGTRADAAHRAQVWISVAWALYGSALLGIGFRRAQAGLRWAGIAMFGLTLAKVLLFDMATLEPVYRIGSSLLLGLLLVGASFLYTKKRTNGSS